MASVVTNIADIIVPDIWVPYMQERTAAKSELIQSGLVDRDPAYNTLVSQGSNTVNMPFFQDLTGRSQSLSESTPLETKKITASKDVAVIQRRGDAWSTQDLSRALSGADPGGAIADLVADYWVRDMQATLLLMLKGIFASTTMAAQHVLNISIADGVNAAATNLISSGAVIDAFKLLGDRLDGIAGMAMHSDIYWALEKQNLIEYLPPAEQGAVPIRTYRGKTLIVDDSLPKVAGGTSGFVYTTYLFGTNAIAFGEDPMPMGAAGEQIAVEVDRDILAGQSYLTNRRHFIMHMKGVKWTGTIAGDTPADAELEAGASWARVFEKKNVPALALLTNG